MISQLKRSFVRNKIVKETTWAILAKGLTFVLLYALDVFLPRCLGPEKYGEWAFFFSFITIFALMSHLGINSSTQTFVARYLGTPDLRPVFSASLKLRLGASLLFVPVLYWGARPLTQYIGRPELTSLFQVAIPLVMIIGFVEYFRHIFMGLHRIKYHFAINLCEYGLRLALSILFLHFWLELTAVVHAFSVAGVLAILLAAFLLYRNFLRGLPSSGNRFARDIFMYSIPMFVLSIGFMMLTELDNIMIGLILKDDHQVAMYAVAQRIVVKLPQFNLALAMGSLPLFARLTEENKPDLWRLLMRLLKINTVIFGGVCIGILATSWFLIPLIYGQAYRASVMPLNILVLYMLIFSYSMFLSGVLDYRGLAGRRAINLSVAIAVKIVLSLSLIPRFGINGAAFATSVCCIPYLALNWLEVKKDMKPA